MSFHRTMSPSTNFGMPGESKADVSSMSESEGRKGWAAVGLHLERRDRAMIKDCDEDISTLLIVAGLFSTVLTAFIVESYQWLQEDYTQTSAELLGLVVSELRSDPKGPAASTGAQAKLNSFATTISAVVINILWFLSLIVSLAAALLGMMVKQWMREYQMVDSESPEDVIWLRQIRYQAFIQWKVPFIVATLPALLEFALILFMSGLITLLWTLHITVASIISVAVLIFLVVASAATAMPALFPSCPYKSPTSWCCVLLWNALVRGLYRILWIAGHAEYTSYLSRLLVHREAEGWKQRDIQTDWHHELSRRWGGEWNMDEDLKVEAIKLAHLADAVAWVRENTQNDQTYSDVCLSTASSRAGSSTRLRLLAPIYASCRQNSIDPLHFMREHWYHHRPEPGRYGTYSFQPTAGFDAWDPWRARNGITVLEILGTILLRHLETFVIDIFLLDAEAYPHNAEDMHAFVGGLCFLYHVARTSPKSALAKEFVDLLVLLYNRLARAEQYDQQYPSLRTFCVQILQRMGSFRFVGVEIHVDLDHLYMTFADYTRTALHIYFSDRSHMSRENRHLFATLADLALARCTAWNPYNHEVDEMKALLQCMDEALQSAIEDRVSNCGFYDGFPWISTLAMSPNRATFIYMPPSLPANLEKNVDSSLRPAVRDQLKTINQRCTLLSGKALTNGKPCDIHTATACTGTPIVEVSVQEARARGQSIAAMPSSPKWRPSQADLDISLVAQADKSVNSASESSSSRGSGVFLATDSTATSYSDVPAATKRPCAAETAVLCGTFHDRAIGEPTKENLPKALQHLTNSLGPEASHCDSYGFVPHSPSAGGYDIVSTEDIDHLLQSSARSGINDIDSPRESSK